MRLATIITGLLMAIAGVVHFVRPGVYLRIMPAFLPWPSALVFWSGVAEVLLGLMLCFPATQRIAAMLLAALMVGFLLVHVAHVIHPPALGLPVYVYWVRLALQPVLVYWFWRMRHPL